MFTASRNEILRPINAISQFKRFRGKINIQRPRAPHFERAKYLQVTAPFFKKRVERPLYETCGNVIKSSKTADVEYPYQRFLANDLLKELKSSRLVGFFHKNPMSGEEEHNALIMFKKENMDLKTYGLKTVEMAVNGTQYEAIKQLFVSHNMLVFSPQPEIKKFLSILKKFPQLVLLAAILEGKFICRDELQKYNLIPSVQIAQAEFVQTLDRIGGQLTSHLSTRSNILVSQLQERVKQLEDDK